MRGKTELISCHRSLRLDSHVIVVSFFLPLSNSATNACNSPSAPSDFDSLRGSEGSHPVDTTHVLAHPHPLSTSYGWHAHYFQQPLKTTEPTSPSDLKVLPSPPELCLSTLHLGHDMNNRSMCQESVTKSLVFSYGLHPETALA